MPHPVVRLQPANQPRQQERLLPAPALVRQLWGESPDHFWRQRHPPLLKPRERRACAKAHGERGCLRQPDRCVLRSQKQRAGRSQEHELNQRGQGEVSEKSEQEHKDVPSEQGAQRSSFQCQSRSGKSPCARSEKHKCQELTGSVVAFRTLMVPIVICMHNNGSR